VEQGIVRRQAAVRAVGAASRASTSDRARECGVTWGATRRQYGSSHDRRQLTNAKPCVSYSNTLFRSGTDSLASDHCIGNTGAPLAGSKPSCDTRSYSA
jgi:hypothetical protein